MSLTAEQFVKTGFARAKPSPNSQKNYRVHIDQFEAFLKERNKTAQDGTVVDQDILDYIELIKPKYQPNTVAAKVAAISSYFKWLKKEGALTHKPNVRSYPKVLPTHKEISRPELNVMIQNMTGNELNKQRDLAMFSMILYCGFKTEEVVTINTENVDFKTAEIIRLRPAHQGMTVLSKKGFRGAFSGMLAYARAKAQNGFCWKNLATDRLTYTPDTGDKKEPFFLNKNCLRISGRSLRRRLLAYLEKSHSYTMRDLSYTYLQNLDRVIEHAAEIQRK